MKRETLTILCLISAFGALYAQSTGDELVDASIRFHDPDDNWSLTKVVLGFNDTRPGKEDRAASFSFDNQTGEACVTRELDGRKVTWHIKNEECKFEIDGSFDLSDQEKADYNLSQERGLLMRNYYLYLWGLPMKLKDPGTKIDPKIYDKTFNGRDTKVARVTYEKEVGSDTWYFYFDPETFEMIGYQFYHDEEKGDGEYITLNGLEFVNGMKIPKSRSWYTNPDSTLLGTDNLVHSYIPHKHD